MSKPELPDWQARLIDERVREMEKNPDAWISWGQIEKAATAALAKRGA